jgi:hypothetical protein
VVVGEGGRFRAGKKEGRQVEEREAQQANGHLKRREFNARNT